MSLEIMKVEDEAAANIENEEEEITGVNERDETEADGELGRGRRRKAGNR